MSRKVDLSLTKQTVSLPSTQSYKIRITAQNCVDMSCNIFKMLYSATDNTSSFISIVNPDEIISLPISVSDVTVSSYFRTNSIDLTYSSIEIANAGWESIKSATQTLVNALNLQDTLGTATIVTIQ